MALYPRSIRHELHGEYGPPVVAGRLSEAENGRDSFATDFPVDRLRLLGPIRRRLLLRPPSGLSLAGVEILRRRLFGAAAGSHADVFLLRLSHRRLQAVWQPKVGFRHQDGETNDGNRGTRVTLRLSS